MRSSLLRSTLRVLGPLAVVMLPALALADPATPPVLSLKAGPAYSITQMTLGLAWGGCFFGMVVALFFEWANGGHGGKHHFAPILTRTVLVVIGLKFYGTIFGSVVATANSLANQVTPHQAYTQFWDDSRAKLGKLLMGNVGDILAGANGSTAASLTGAAGTTASAPTTPAPAATPNWWDFNAQLARSGAALGGMVFASMLSMLIVFCLVIHKLFGLLGAVIVGFLYAMGPLALAASVPRHSGVLGSWFRSLVTVAAWPIVSGLLTQLVFAVGQQWNQTGEAVEIGALFNAVVLVALALVTPSLASSMIGGIGNVAGPGLEMMTAGVALTAYKAQSALQQHRKERDAKAAALQNKPNESPGGAGAPSAGVISNPVAGPAPAAVPAPVTAFPEAARESHPVAPGFTGPQSRLGAYQEAHDAALAGGPPLRSLPPDQALKAATRAHAAGMAAQSRLNEPAALAMGPLGPNSSGGCPDTYQNAYDAFNAALPALQKMSPAQRVAAEQGAHALAEGADKMEHEVGKSAYNEVLAQHPEISPPALEAALEVEGLRESGHPDYAPAFAVHHQARRAEQAARDQYRQATWGAESKPGAASPVAGGASGGDGGTAAAAPKARREGRRPPPPAAPLEKTNEAHPGDLVRAGAANPPVGAPLPRKRRPPPPPPPSREVNPPTNPR